MLRFATRSIAFALALLAAVGCEEPLNCHRLHAEPGAEIRLDRSVFRPARYDLELAYDQRSYRCAAEIEAGDAPIRGEVVVDDDATFGPATSRYCEPSDPGVVRLAIDRGLTLTISGEAPERVHLSVREAGEPLFETDVTLEYESEELNGPGCGGTDRAEVTVRLP